MKDLIVCTKSLTMPQANTILNSCLFPSVNLISQLFLSLFVAAFLHVLPGGLSMSCTDPVTAGMSNWGAIREAGDPAPDLS